MKLPFIRGPREIDPAVAGALDRLAERLDRLIAIGEQTNQILEGLGIPAVPPGLEAGHGAQAQAVEAAETMAASQPTQAAARSETKFTDGGRHRRKPRGGQAGHVPPAAPRRLHEAIIHVLLDAGEGLTANDIAARIRERNLFVPPRSGHELRGGQVSARVGNATYRDRFVRRDGRIWLVDPDGERRGRKAL